MGRLGFAWVLLGISGPHSARVGTKKAVKMTTTHGNALIMITKTAQQHPHQNNVSVMFFSSGVLAHDILEKDNPPSLFHQLG